MIVRPLAGESGRLIGQVASAQWVDQHAARSLPSPRSCSGWDSVDAQETVQGTDGQTIAYGLALVESPRR